MVPNASIWFERFGYLAQCLVGLPLLWSGVLGVAFPGSYIGPDSGPPVVPGESVYRLITFKYALLAAYGTLLLAHPKLMARSPRMRYVLLVPPFLLASVMYWIPSADTGFSYWRSEQATTVIMFGYLVVLVLYSLPSLWALVLSGLVRPT